MIEKEPGLVSRYSDSVTGWTVGATGFDCRRGVRIFFSSPPRPDRDLGPTQLPIQWVPGVKQPEREDDHSPPSSANVKNTWKYTSTLQYAFTSWCLVKHRSNFTFHNGREIVLNFKRKTKCLGQGLEVISKTPGSQQYAASRSVLIVMANSWWLPKWRHHSPSTGLDSTVTACAHHCLYGTETNYIIFGTETSKYYTASCF
jgi:hypothetical protein